MSKNHKRNVSPGPDLDRAESLARSLASEIKQARGLVSTEQAIAMRETRISSVAGSLTGDASREHGDGRAYLRGHVPGARRFAGTPDSRAGTIATQRDALPHRAGSTELDGAPRSVSVQGSAMPVAIATGCETIDAFLDSVRLADATIALETLPPSVRATLDARAARLGLTPAEAIARGHLHGLDGAGAHAARFTSALRASGQASRYADRPENTGAIPAARMRVRGGAPAHVPGDRPVASPCTLAAMGERAREASIVSLRDAIRDHGRANGRDQRRALQSRIRAILNADPGLAPVALDAGWRAV